MIQSTHQHKRQSPKTRPKHRPGSVVAVLFVCSLSLLHQASSSSTSHAASTRPRVPPPPPRHLPAITEGAASVDPSRQPPPPPKQHVAPKDDKDIVFKGSPQKLAIVESPTTLPTTTESDTPPPPPPRPTKDGILHPPPAVPKETTTQPENPQATGTGTTDPPPPPPPRRKPEDATSTTTATATTTTSGQVSLGLSLPSQSRDDVPTLVADMAMNDEESVSASHEPPISAGIGADDEESGEETASTSLGGTMEGTMLQLGAPTKPLAGEIGNVPMESREQEDSSNRALGDKESAQATQGPMLPSGNMEFHSNTPAASDQPHATERAFEQHAIHQVPSSPYPVQRQQYYGSSSHVSSQPHQYRNNMDAAHSQRLQPRHHASQSYQPQYPAQTSSNPSGRPPHNHPSGSKVLRSFWSKVEKGLDGLADLEDVISGRAQQLVTSAVPKMPFRQTATPAPTRQPAKPNQPKRNTAPQGLSGPELRWQQQRKLSGHKKAPSPVGPRRPVNPAQQHLVDATSVRSPQGSVSMHHVSGTSSSSSSHKQVEKQAENPSADGRRQWQDSLPSNARKLMPANGGASLPHDDGGPSYPGDQRVSSENPQGSNPNRNHSPNEHTTPSEPGQLSPEPSKLESSPLHLEQGDMSDHVRMGQAQPNARKEPFPVSRQADGPRNQEATPWSTASSTATNPDRENPPPRPSTFTPTTSSHSYLDDDDERPSKIARFLGAIPIPSFGKLLRFGRTKSYNYASLDAWEAADDKEKTSKRMFRLFRGKERASAPAVPSTKKIGKESVVAQPVQQLLERSARGKSMSLLSPENKRHIRGLGQSRAALDMAALDFILVGIRQLPRLQSIPIPISLYEFGYSTIPSLLEVFVLSLDTWAPLAFAAAILTLWSNSLLYDRRIQRRAAEVAATAEAEAKYSRLYLRLISSTASSRGLPARIANAARLQGIALAETSRLESFISYAAVTIILTTVSFIKPLCVCLARALYQLVSLQELRCWPLPVGKLIAGITTIVGGAGRDITSLLESQLKGAGHHPLQVAFKVCILAALLSVAYLPSLEKRRKILPSDDEEEDSDEAALKMAEQISSLGSSSASRLSFQSKRGWAESAIERWRLVQDESSVVDADISIGSLVRRLGYYIASWVILAAPLLIFGFFLRTPMTGWSSTPMSPWQSLMEVSVLLLYTNGLVWEAMTKVVESRDLDPDIPGFLESLAQASSEMTSQNASARPLMGAFSPTAGLMVKDFWSAHVYRRGWAVRGAHLSCRSGEVVVVLGDDGSGKSRLLTTLAESIVSPPKQSFTGTKVRGSIAVGGIDVAQWERKELRKRVGVCLTDVHTLSLRAGLWSGMSLEEILEPGDGLLKVADPTHTSGPVEKACVVLALKITGLYWSLLPRLPSKLSTILTANEEELRPSPLRPRYHLVSPTDWSKLLVAQVLAQAMYDNDNTSGSADRFDNRLVGSILLLDDGTNMLSEIEESNLLRDLRRTGVATVLSSNKWATGRLADRIAVMKDGAIIETGTHHELLSRGPQQSWYAAKWNAMAGS